MNGSEIALVFSVFATAFPAAKMFRGEDVKAQTALWLECTKDIPGNVATAAAVEFCKRSKYPPTIAEYREIAENLMDEAVADARTAFESACFQIFNNVPEQAYRELPERTRKAIDACGGLDCFCYGVDADFGRFVDAWIGIENDALMLMGGVEK